MRTFLFWNTNDVTVLSTLLLPQGAVEVDQCVLKPPRGVESPAEAVDGRQGDGVHSERCPGVLDGGLILSKMIKTPFGGNVSKLLE